MKNNQEARELCWLVTADETGSVNMRITYTDRVGENSVFRGYCTEKGMPVYNAAASPDRDFISVTNEQKLNKGI